MTRMDRERWRDLAPLLDHALDLPARDREAWLDALCVQSPTLAVELRSLLAAEAAADARGFLATPIARPLAARTAALRPGLEIDGYTIERALGRGGMGSVWLARRADGRFDEPVALKVLHDALTVAEGAERFRREGQVLARLAHPGIARLLDAGVTESGRPYLVLEYVAGDPIDAFANAQGLTLADRLRLVLQVLAAVGHAHERLVIHRDLKPSNILVGPGPAASGHGTVKLLDFGIAKLVDGGRDRTPLTRDGAAPLTPEFAAPEQLAGEPVTTATDVYAVGVLLYMLVTGRRPYDLAARTLAEIERTVRAGEPPRPSAAVAQGGGAEALRRQLRGDVDAIVMKAMHCDAARRYPTATALADDLQRYLDGRPVCARPDSARYRLRKFVGRHRGGVAFAAAAAALLVVGASRERALRGRAETEARTARAVEEYLVSVFDVADPYGRPGTRGSDVTARVLLDRGAARVDTALAAEPAVRADLRVALGRVYGNLGLFGDAERLLRQALAERRASHGPRHPAVAEAMDRLGQVLVRQDRFAEAEPLLRDALAQRRAMLGRVDAATAESLDHLATLLQERGAVAEAEPLFREAVDVRRAVHGPDHAEVANALNNLAVLRFVRGAYDEAEPLYREALAIETVRLGVEHLLTVQTMHNLAQTQSARGRFAEADTLYRRALAVKRRLLGDTHPSVTVNLNNLAIMLAQELGQLDEAEAMIREALALDRRMFGERHSYVAEGLRNLGTVLRLKGEFDAAERTYRRTLAMNRALFGEGHPRVARALANVADVRSLRGDVAGAIPLYRQSLPQLERALGVRHRNHLAVSVSLARALREAGAAAEAAHVLHATLARMDTSDRGQRPQLVAALATLGETLVDLDRAAEALPVAARAVASSRERFGAGDWRTGEARLAQGRSLAAMGERARAVAALRDAAATLARHARAQPRLARRAAEALAALDASAHHPPESAPALRLHALRPRATPPPGARTWPSPPPPRRSPPPAIVSSRRATSAP